MNDLYITAKEKVFEAFQSFTDNIVLRPDETSEMSDAILFTNAVWYLRTYGQVPKTSKEDLDNLYFFASFGLGYLRKKYPDILEIPYISTIYQEAYSVDYVVGIINSALSSIPWSENSSINRAIMVAVSRGQRTRPAIVPDQEYSTILKHCNSMQKMRYDPEGQTKIIRCKVCSVHRVKRTDCPVCGCRSPLEDEPPVNVEKVVNPFKFSKYKIFPDNRLEDWRL